MNRSAPEWSNALAFERKPPLGRRILIVEDEMLIALGLIYMVEALGSSGVAASRVVKALALLATETFDAAIVDMNLAGEPADAVMDALSTRAIPFIITTGYDVQAIGAKYRSQPRLTKPYLPEQVETALLQALAPTRCVARR